MPAELNKVDNKFQKQIPCGGQIILLGKTGA